MEISTYAEQVRRQLVVAAALGDDTTRRVADALAEAAQPAVRLAVLAAVTAAADEITAALLDLPGAPAVSVRMDGEELGIEVRPAEAAGPVAGEPEDNDTSARISLRLSEGLKAQVETAARRESLSVNTWLVRAAASALGSTSTGRRDQRGSAHRITGWVNG